jgi:uncharacterized repeat protein (TIGR03803 family)
MTYLRQALLLAALGLTVAVSYSLRAQTVSNIYSFPGTGSSAGPGFVTPAQGRDGRLYGTTQGTQYGSVFAVSTIGVETDLYAFDLTNGDDPATSLVLSPDGSFYGTAAGGGASNDGVLYKISVGGAYTALHQFAGGTDGIVPVAAPLLASDGNLYGTTEGGPNEPSTVYKYGSASGLTTIYQFDGTHGSTVFAPLTQGKDGDLYGAASAGGANNCGTLFKMSRAGVILNYYSLTCGEGGSLPYVPLVQASDGNLYGATQFGGASNYGVLFRWTKKGSFTVLHQFSGTSDGKYPSGLMQATDGNLYGTTTSGGSQGNGVLFKMTTAGAFSLLYNFDSSIGQAPAAAPLQDTNGILYGTVSAGGTYGFGGVYSLNLGLKPFITFVQSSGRAGRTVQILGQNLAGATAVTFNGVAAASFNVLTSTYMTAVVPTGATTGNVVVATPSGKLTSNVVFRIPN